MKPPTIVVTPRAAREIERMVTWWAKYRPSAPELLEREIAGAIEQIRIAPASGPQYMLPNVRRIVLVQTRFELLYTHDVKPGRVRILSLWSTLRGRKPRLRGV